MKALMVLLALVATLTTASAQTDLNTEAYDRVTSVTKAPESVALARAALAAQPQSRLKTILTTYLRVATAPARPASARVLGACQSEAKAILDQDRMYQHWGDCQKLAKSW